MWIQGWAIEAFGAHQNFTTRTLGPNLNVVLGPNEAGKSTLLAFIRGVLFGFPLKRGKPVTYAAAAGLRHGGRLFVSTDLGEATVERFAGKDSPVQVLFQDGRCGSDAELQALLRQADDSLFRNVFAISLNELQNFGTLSASGVRDKIFSAGVAGAGRSARAVIKEFEDSAAPLFRPRSGGVINSILDLLNDLRSRLSAARAEGERYRILLEEEEAAEAAMAALLTKADELRGRHAWFQNLIDLWPIHQNRAEAQRRLAALPAVDAFPPQAAVRLAEARNRIQTARERCETLQMEIETKERLRDAISPELQPTLVSLAADVSDHALSLALHRRNLRERSQCASSLADAQRALEAKLLDLGVDWDERRLKSFDVSIPRREEIRAYADGIENARARHADAQRAVQVARREFEQQEREADRIRDKREALTPPDEHIAEREHALRRLRIAAVNLAALEERRGAQGIGIPIILPFGAYVLGAAFVIGGIWQAGVAWVIAGVVAALCGVVLQVAARRMKSPAKKCDNEIAALSNEIQRDAAVFGMSGPVTPEGIESKAAELDAERTALAEWKRLDQSFAEAVSKRSECEAHAKAAETALEGAGGILKSAEEAWTQRKRELGVSESLSPDGLFQFFTELERARELLRHRDQKSLQLQEIEHQIAAWEERAARQFRVAGMESAAIQSGEELLTHFGDLQRSCNEQLELERRVAGLEAEILSLSRQRETARAALEGFDGELRDLFREAGVADASAFEAKLAVFEERKALTQQIEAVDRAILPEFSEALARGDVQGWSEKRDAAASEMDRCGAERDEAVRRHDAIRRRREECESSADIPSLEAQIEAARVELEDAANRWRVETLAAALLRSTLTDFQRTRQPAVITEAGRYFENVTSGRYIRLLPQDDQETLLVEMAQGGTRKLEELSRGTAEQLYLCLRLAFAREFARRGGALPMVMDDVLVNFDPERSRAVARLLADFAAENQVLLFTCHPETAAIFDDVAPGHARINLART